MWRDVCVCVCVIHAVPSLYTCCFDHLVFRQPWQAHRWLLKLHIFFHFSLLSSHPDIQITFTSRIQITVLDSEFTAIAVTFSPNHTTVDAVYLKNIRHTWQTKTPKYHLEHISQCIFSVLIHTALQLKAQLDSTSAVHAGMTQIQFLVFILNIVALWPLYASIIQVITLQESNRLHCLGLQF